MPIGTVKWFSSSKGYGFIQPEDGSHDVFVHISAVERAGLPDLSVGQKVAFSAREGDTRSASFETVAEVIADAAAHDDDALLQMSEEEWLSANLLALRHEAVARARSLDDTLAYVTGKCAAVREA
jgi:cold shock protein